MEPALTLSAGCNKWDIRQKVWDYIEHKNLADYPRPVHHRIPNFKGAARACERLAALEEFQSATTIKINPDTPQKNARFLVLDAFSRTREVKVDPDKPLEGVRMLALQARKTLLVPTPRLRTGLFNRITPPPGASKEVLRICSTSQGVKEYSVPLGLDSTVQVDLVVVGSVAVSEKGWRIGKGEGFADMEYAMMVAMGAVIDQTIVVTVVHDCQVLDIPEELLGDHDLTVDYILTPTRVIKTDCTRPKPQGIIWSKISREMMDKMPILKKLQAREQRAGKDVTLKKECGSPPARQAGGTPATGTDSIRAAQNVPMEANRGVADLKDVTTVYIGNIPPATRVSEFKTVLREKGATPLHLTWQGAQHRAFLDYADPCQAEVVVSSLEGLNIGGQAIRVELARSQRSNITGRRVFGERKTRSNNPRSHYDPNR